MRMIKHEGDHSIEVNRFYAPYSLEWKCPGCNSDNVHDFKNTSLSYPETNTPIDVVLYCPNCDSEEKVQIQIKINLELVDE